MNSFQKKLLEEDFKDKNEMNKEEKRYIRSETIYALFRCILTFGVNSEIRKEIIENWKQFKRILAEERKINNYIIENFCNMDTEMTYMVLDEIDELNDETFMYYERMFKDFNDAFDTKSEYRAKHFKREFKMLDETDEYKMKIVGLTINFEEIVNYLNYPQEFWEYIKPKIRYIDSKDISEKRMNYETLIKANDKGEITDMIVLVPIIIDYKTACINIHEFKHAYDLYLRLGTIIDEKESYYEESAKELEEKFSKEYVLTKFYKK